MGDEEENENVSTVADVDGALVVDSAEVETFASDTDLHFERLLKVLGYFGLFQIRLVAINVILNFSAGWITLYYMFSNVVPNWKCVRFSGQNLTTSSTFSSNLTLNTSCSGICQINGSKCVEFDYDTTTTVYSIVTEWDLVCDKAFISELSISIQMAGILIGALVCGYLADWLGRKIILLLYCSGVMILQVLVGLSVNYYMFIVLRFFIGFCIAGPFCICFTLPMEFCGPKWRTFIGGFSLFGFGPMLLAFCAYFVGSWDHLAFLTDTVPRFRCRWVPESIRWLTMKGRFEEAEKTIRWMARVNRTQVPDLGLLRALAAQDKSEQEEGKRHNYLDLFCTRELAIQTLTLMYAGFSVSAIFYGISTMYNTFEGSIFINSIVNSCTLIPFIWSTIYFGNRFGRRRSFFGYMSVSVVCLVSALIIGLLDKKSEAGIGILMTILVIVGQGAVLACMQLTIIYCNEAFPTVIRNLGMSSCSIASRIGGIIAPQIAYMGIAIHWTVPYAVYFTFCISVTVLVFLYLPETNRKPLEDAVLVSNKRTNH
ncbi:organic cation transporter protein-like isoform X2 [Tubulanus polymorphus]|uniref:organic cation transporter protein-like isoform X2 n=1 Tax=Tubulanus polymorphus TaxID=672921 RepID=UPI003DA3A975